LELSLPTFRDYARRHGYDVIVGDGASQGRPTAWGKVPLLREALNSYDFAFWIDADALILDPDQDVEALIPRAAFQAYAQVTAPPDVGLTPCTGVWALRGEDRTTRFLDLVWAQEDLIAHPWWEQAAVMRASGWDLGTRPFRKMSSSEWDSGTHILPETWDMIPWFSIGYASGVIRHYAAWQHELRAFDMRTDVAAMQGRRARYSVGLLERQVRGRSRVAATALRRMVTR
jgi:hypothetical protein